MNADNQIEQITSHPIVVQTKLQSTRFAS